jgi:hypothetical protein
MEVSSGFLCSSLAVKSDSNVATSRVVCAWAGPLSKTFKIGMVFSPVNEGCNFKRTSKPWKQQLMQIG